MVVFLFLYFPLTCAGEIPFIVIFMLHSFIASFFVTPQAELDRSAVEQQKYKWELIIKDAVWNKTSSTGGLIWVCFARSLVQVSIAALMIHAALLSKERQCADRQTDTVLTIRIDKEKLDLNALGGIRKVIWTQYYGFFSHVPTSLTNCFHSISSEH